MGTSHVNADDPDAGPGRLPELRAVYDNPEIRETEEKAASRLARKIARDVAERGLQPGSVLAPEHAMAQEFGVGRGTIREALRLLESQGLVVMRRGIGGGPVVGHPDGAHLGRTMTLFLQHRHTRFSDAMASWVFLEGEVAADATRSYPKAKVEFRRPLLGFIEDPETVAADDDAWLNRAVEDFHQIIWNLTSNTMLRLLVEAVAAIVFERVHFNPHEPFKPEDRAKSRREHLVIAKAVTAGDVATARSLMERHGRRVSRMLRRKYPGLFEQVIDWH